mmetsp:Transcript_4119/g.10285  ORF Transcript_4119/g.10285 Transcript_4119/m.10285 type:complete len:224 (-) Transcript_4119:110-781(-)
MRPDGDALGHLVEHLLDDRQPLLVELRLELALVPEALRLELLEDPFAHLFLRLLATLLVGALLLPPLHALLLLGILLLVAHRELDHARVASILLVGLHAVPHLVPLHAVLHDRAVLLAQPLWLHLAPLLHAAVHLHRALGAGRKHVHRRQRRVDPEVILARPLLRIVCLLGELQGHALLAVGPHYLLDSANLRGPAFVACHPVLQQKVGHLHQPELGVARLHV